MECTCSHAIAAPLRIVSSSHISGPQHSELLWSLFSLTYLSIPAEKFVNRDVFFVHLQMISSNYIKCNVMVLNKMAMKRGYGGQAMLRWTQDIEDTMRMRVDEAGGTGNLSRIF